MTRVFVVVFMFGLWSASSVTPLFLDFSWLWFSCKVFALLAVFHVC